MLSNYKETKDSDKVSFYQVLNGANLDNALKTIYEKANTIKKIDCSGCCIGDKEAIKIAEVITSLPYLTELQLYGNQMGDEGASAIADAILKNVTLKKLNLCTNKIQNDGARFLVTALKKRGKEFELLLSGNEDITPMVQIAIFNEIKEHKFLNLTLKNQSLNIVQEDKDLTDIRLRPTLFSMRKLPIAKIKLSNCLLRDNDLQDFIENIKHCQTLFLEELDLSANHLTEVTTAMFLPVLEKCTKLKRINLSKNEISQDGIFEFIKVMVHHPATPEFEIVGNKETGIIHFKNQNFSGRDFFSVLWYLKKIPCTQLSLINCSLTPKGAEKLASVIKTDQLIFLKKIDLSFNQLSDAAALPLAEILQHCAYLEEIDLSHNHITDKNAAEVAQILKNCTRLKKIDFSYNQFGKQGIETLRKAIEDHSASPELNLLNNREIFEVKEENEVKREHKEGDGMTPKLSLNKYPSIFGLPADALSEDHFFVPELKQR